MSRSRTVVHVEDLTTISIGTDTKGQMHVLIGEEDEHQVELVASAATMTELAGSIVDCCADHIKQLNLQLREWVAKG